MLYAVIISLTEQKQYYFNVKRTVEAKETYLENNYAP